MSNVSNAERLDSETVDNVIITPVATPLGFSGGTGAGDFSHTARTNNTLELL